MSHLIFMLFILFDHLTPVWADGLSCFPETKCVDKLNLNSSASLTVLVKGHGTVNHLAFSCETTCQQEYPPGSAITLTATSAPGYLFDKWEGDCQGTDQKIVLSLEGQKTCIAQFIPQTCQPALYSASKAQLSISTFTAEMYFPLSDTPNGDYALCTGKGGELLTLKYQLKEEAFLLSKQEIICDHQPVKLPDYNTCPLYSAQHRTLEIPALQVTSEVLLPGGKKLTPGKCYQAHFVQGIKSPYGINRPPSVVDSKFFTLVYVEEQSLCE